MSLQMEMRDKSHRERERRGGKHNQVNAFSSYDVIFHVRLQLPLSHKYSHSSTSVSSLPPFQHFPYPPLPKDSRAMYAHPNTAFSRAADFPGLSTSPELTLPLALPSAPFLPPNLLLPDHLSAAELDSVPDALRTLNSEVGNSSSCSGCSSYGSPNSLASQGPSFIQRSVSSHSLQKNGFRQLVSPTREFLDSDESPVRRVFSTGDLQRIKMVQRCHRSESPLSNENSIIIESMSKACRYSPEEKKERIERYRSKRNQRNFNKKIKYACRKTLADSRPRIRGRFARNDEIEKSSQVQWSHMGGEEDEEDDDDWINFISTFSANMGP